MESSNVAKKIGSKNYLLRFKALHVRLVLLADRVRVEAFPLSAGNSVKFAGFSGLNVAMGRR